MQFKMVFRDVCTVPCKAYYVSIICSKAVNLLNLHCSCFLQAPSLCVCVCVVSFSNGVSQPQIPGNAPWPQESTAIYGQLDFNCMSY